MDIKYLKINEIHPYKLNAKQHPESQIIGIAESIKRFGFTQPLVLNSKNEVLIGHGRLEAARLAGLEAIPCVVKSDLTADEERALRLIDNRIAETGWDVGLLNLSLEELHFDFTPFNIDFGELTAEIINNFDPSKEWDGMPDFENVPRDFRSLVVHFETEANFLNFEKMINQKISEKTTHIWFPEKEREVLKDKAWDESK